MRIVLTLQVRDEEDIIDANIKFHLAQGVDFFIVTDNLSVDGTRDILLKYERSGILRYIWQPEDIHAQGEWVTHMARLAASEHNADWVINTDADEFWLAEQGNLKDVLGRVPPSFDAVAAERSNFLPPEGTHRSQPFWTTMVIREAHSLNVLGEPLFDKVCHRARADIEVYDGNHVVFVRGQPLDTTRLPLLILHFPQRSYGQFANKIAKGGAALKRNTALRPKIGATWRYLHDKWLKGELEAIYSRSIPDAATVNAGLADGTYVRDERLKFILTDILGGNRSYG